MIKPIMTGVWVCAATMGSAYLGAHWQKPPSEPASQSSGHGASNELTPVRTRMISVPIVADGGIRGYVVAQLAFTAPANLMKTMSVKPDMYVLDEAFQLIFSGDTIDFRQFKKQDLPAFGKRIAENVNKRLGVHVVDDVFVQELNYVPKDNVRGGR